MAYFRKKRMDRKQERMLHEKDAMDNIQIEQTKGIIGLFYKMYITDTRNFALKSRDKLILDIGAGDGIILENLKLNPIEMDVAFERCRRLFVKQKRVICGSGFNLPFRNESIDCVLLIALLEHTSNPEFIINETHRVLKREGEAAILIPNDVAMSLGRVLLFKFPPRYPGHISFITPKKIENWVKGKFEITNRYNLPWHSANFWLSMYHFVYLKKT